MGHEKIQIYYQSVLQILKLLHKQKIQSMTVLHLRTLYEINFYHIY